MLALPFHPSASIAAVGAAASDPTPAAPAAGSATRPAQLDEGALAAMLASSRLRVGDLWPERPTAGQLAQLQLTISPADAIGRQRPFSTAERAALASLLFRNVSVRVADSALDQDQIQVGITRAEYDPVARRFAALVSIRFRWPVDRSGILGLGFAQTITQEVELRERATGASWAFLVETHIPTSVLRVVFVVMVGILLLIVAPVLAIVYRRRLFVRPVSGLERDEGDDGLARRPGRKASAMRVPGGIEKVTIPRGARIPEIPTALAAAVAEGTAVLVLGAAASEQAGLPSAERLLLRMIKKLAADLPEGLTYVLSDARPEQELARLQVKLGGYAKVMDAVVNAVPRDQVAAVIADILAKAQATPTLLAGLAELPWRALIVLTWDDLADRTFAKHRPSSLPQLRKFTRSEASEVLTAIRNGERLLLRPLGDLQRPNSLSLSIEEFRRNMVRSPDFPRAIGSLLQSHCVLFFGVGTDTLEPFLQTVAPELESSEPRHYALLPDDRTNEVWAPTLARFGVQILPFEGAEGSDALLAFADNLRREAKARRVTRSPQPRAGLPGLAPESIGHLHLTNIGPFESLDLSFATVETGTVDAPKPWSVIFGGNGVGKSSILRAIALVLAGDDPGGRRAGQRLLKTGATEGTIELQIGGHSLKTLLVRDRSTIEVLSPQHTPVQSGAALVLGFPALRGARAPDPGGPSLTDKVRGPEPADLLPLINGEVDGRLGDFKQWLTNILVQAADGSQPRAAAMRDLLDQIIADIVPGQVSGLAPIDPRDFLIRMKTPEGDVPFDDLSQGMASIFNWVGILAQRLFEICAQSAAPNLEPAVVLIDEVDAHLHPEWQRQLVKLTRTHFPNVQIIATSHSPLLAGSLHGHEMIILERNPETQGVELFDQEIEMFGQPSQNILTSVVFGLPTDRNPEVERLIHAYLDLFQKPERSAEEERELAEMKAKLDRYRYGAAALGIYEDDDELSATEVEAMNRRFGPKAPVAGAMES